MKSSLRLKIPKWPYWILKKLAFNSLPEGYAGDIEEEYEERIRNFGKRKTNAWIWIHALTALPGALKYTFVWSVIMIKNYLKIALRNFHRNKGYSFFNITGLIIGMGCCLFIGLYSQYELSFDKFHLNRDRIYRINLVSNQTGGVTTAPALAPAMKNDFPEVENIAQMYDPGNSLIKLNNSISFGTKLIYASEHIFDVFTFPFINGIPETALEKPYSAVIDEETALKYFKNEDPIGKTLNISTRFGVHDFQITGIMKNFPINSHFDAHIFIPLETMRKDGVNLNVWGSNYMHSYVLLRKNSDYRAVEKKIPSLREKYTGYKLAGYTLQPLADIHMKSADLSFQLKPGGDINSIYILSFTAFLILLIGCGNYINSFIALSFRRFQEIGLRKVFGAQKSKLVNQFLCESLLMIIMAGLLSVLVVYLLMNPLSNLFGTRLVLNLANIPVFILLALGIATISLCLSGLYPAFYLSKLKPADIFKRAYADRPGKTFFRNSFLIVQFAISVFLIIASVGITKQMEFVKTKKLGFNREHILVIPVTQNLEALNRQDAFKTEMRNIPGVRNLSFSSTIPMDLDWRNAVDYEGRTDKAENIQICCSYVDSDYLDVFGLELFAGRNFLPDIPSDAVCERAFIINETGAKRLGWEDPIGKKMRFEQKEMGTVIGLVKDFHNLPMSQRIEPVALMQTKMKNKRLLSIKIRSENIQETISGVERIWNNFSNGWPFEYEFMDKAYDNMYKSEICINNQFRFFSALAIFLSCFGLFGFVSFVIKRRTKEIAIRKVLGASVSEIFALFARGFLKQIILANIIAWPIAYYFMNKWLQNFAYRTNIGFYIFIVAGTVSIVVSLITIISQTYKAAVADPVKSIRNE
jgi:putative ABC transport system permease protein